MLLKWLLDCGYSMPFVMAMILLAIMATMLYVMPFWITTMRNASHRVRDDVPERHLSKQGTPSMGGVPWMLCLILGWLLLIPWHHHLLWMEIVLVVGFMLIGAKDDWGKRSKNDLKAWQKALAQIIVGALVISLWWFTEGLPTATMIPGVGMIHLGWGYAFWALFVLIGSSNASNLTDGLDGLLTSVWLTIVMGLMLCVFAVSYLKAPVSFECWTLLITMFVTGLCFLWFNTYPAQVFMGDSASIVLGPMLALMALYLGIEWIFAIMSCVMIAETISVILQVGSFKLRKKRVFKMAPIHHHFELMGLHECTIVTRFVIVSMVCVGLGYLCLLLII